MFIVKQKLIKLDQLLEKSRDCDPKEPWCMAEMGDGLGDGSAVGGWGWFSGNGCGYNEVNQEQAYDAGEGKGGG